MINILCHTISNRHHSNFHITWTIFHPFDFMCEMLFCWVERSWIRILSFKTVCVLFYCLLLLPLVVYNIVKTSGTSLFSPLYIHTGFSADNFHSKLCQVSNFSVCQGVFLNILRRNRGEDREMEKKGGKKPPSSWEEDQDAAPAGIWPQKRGLSLPLCMQPCLFSLEVNCSLDAKEDYLILHFKSSSNRSKIMQGWERDWFCVLTFSPHFLELYKRMSLIRFWQVLSVFNIPFLFTPFSSGVPASKFTGKHHPFVQ